MNKKKHTLIRWLFSSASLVLLVGFLMMALLFKQTNTHMYPALIADSYRDPKHRLTVPGDLEVNLTRSGAYGIYFEHDLKSPIYPDIAMPPELDCSLTSKSNGAVIKAVSDYVKTNRYTSNNLYTGVLIMSITVNKPGVYTFACDYQDGRMEPEIWVALGPNYFWEFLRVVWKIGLPILGGTSIFCTSLLLALLLLATGFAFKARNTTRLGTKK